MRARNFIAEQELFEINMSPGNLAKLASEIDARVGMEFEMIVPVESYDYGDDGAEPDYDQDQRVRSMDSIEQFFNDRNYNSRLTVNQVMSDLQEQYLESDSYTEDLEDAFREEADYYLTQVIESELGEELRELAEARADARPEGFYQTDRDRRDAVDSYYNELVQERVQQSMEEQDQYYAAAREHWDSDGDYDYSDAMDAWVRREYRWMTDIENSFSDLTWPHWTEPEQVQQDIDTVVDSFKQAIGRPVVVSRSYHGVKRDNTRYIIEPDSSIEYDSGEQGLEFVSPPLSLEEMTKDLENVKEWARLFGCRTNKSTGLHINVSVPNLANDKLDYIKLTLLLGDKYVLEQFDRYGNTYCKSAFDEIARFSAGSSAEKTITMLEKLRQGLNRLASRTLALSEHSKYISIHRKEKYIEFRSPGGDWLNEDLKKLLATMNRFVVALDAAVDENKYQKEYSKKLYQLIAPREADEDDTIKYFSSYVAGKIPKQALKSFLRQANIKRGKKTKPPVETEQKNWYKVYSDGRANRNSASLELLASSERAAIDKALELWRSSRLEHPNIEAEYLRAQDTESAQAGGSAAGSSQRAFEPTRELTAPDTQPEANWAIVHRISGQPVNYFISDTRQEAQERFMNIVGNAEHLYRLVAVTPQTAPDTIYEIYHYTNGDAIHRFRAESMTAALAQYRILVNLEDRHLFGLRRADSEPIPGSTVDLQRQRAAQQSSEFTGQWMLRVDGETLTTIQAATQQEANQRARAWISQQSPEFLRQHQGGEVDVLPVGR